MIVFSSVSKSFADQPTAITDFNLEIKPGELVVITGPSGAGKTTLMKLLIREYMPSEGEIIFDELKLSQLRRKQVPELRRKIGVVFQDYKLIEEMNVWENIALPLYIAGKKEAEIESRITDLLNLIGLADKALHFPRQLSGGEAQRVSIARALATAPKVIFADEPTGNLDSEASLRITRLLKKINELGTTLLFATHDDLVLQELAGAKTIHLEKPSKKADKTKHKAAETDTKTEASIDTENEPVDEERLKIKRKQAELEEKMHQAEQLDQEDQEKTMPVADKKIKATNSKTDKDTKHKAKKESEEWKHLTLPWWRFAAHPIKAF